jgi:hypothetical protein
MMDHKSPHPYARNEHMSFTREAVVELRDCLRMLDADEEATRLARFLDDRLSKFDSANWMLDLLREEYDAEQEKISL